MRYHFWQFLINQEGQPINDANVSVYFAGTTTPIKIYTGELTSTVLNVAPQLTTNSNGYFEFWVGDEDEPNGYPRGTKIKLAWDRPGIASGIVDNVEVFQTIEGVNENDPDSIYKNKLISNALAYKFNSHSEHDVLEDGFPIHGLMMVDTTSNENVFNRVISNRLGTGWEDHRNYIFIEPTSIELENSAHGLQPIQFGSTDSTYNKLMSNQLFYNINNAFRDITSSVYTESFAASAWDYDGVEDIYFITIDHDTNEEYPFVVCWDTSLKEKYDPTKIYMIDENSITLYNQSAVDTYIRIGKI